MAKLRANFSLYSRKMKAGTVWYYRTYTPDGLRTSGNSTGCTSKTKARLYCEQLLKEGKLCQGKSMTFAVYAKDWFVWDKCPYLLDKLAQGTKDNPGITEDYAKHLLGYLDNYISPYFGNMKIESISPAKIKAWRIWLQGEKIIGEKTIKGLSNKTINNVTTALHLMTDWAMNENILLYDPFRSVTQFKTSGAARDAFTLEQSMRILSVKWDKYIAWLYNLTASLTGMRESEIRAIRKETLFPEYIDCKDQYKTSGLAPIKTKEKRKIPIPKTLYTLLSREIKNHTYAFQLEGKTTPVNPLYAVRELYLMFPEDVQAEKNTRGFCFHSWRHFFNTFLRSENVSDAKIMAIMGHSSGKGSMTENYTTWRPEMFPEVYAAQEKLIGSLLKENCNILV